MLRTCIRAICSHKRTVSQVLLKFLLFTERNLISCPSSHSWSRRQAPLPAYVWWVPQPKPLPTACQPLSLPLSCWWSGHVTRLSRTCLHLLPHCEPPKMVRPSELSRFGPSFLAESSLAKNAEYSSRQSLSVFTLPSFQTEPFLLKPLCPLLLVSHSALLPGFVSFRFWRRILPHTCCLHPSAEHPSLAHPGRGDYHSFVSETVWLEGLCVTPETTEIQWCSWWGLQSAADNKASVGGLQQIWTMPPTWNAFQIAVSCTSQGHGSVGF